MIDVDFRVTGRRGDIVDSRAVLNKSMIVTGIAPGRDEITGDLAGGVDAPGGARRPAQSSQILKAALCAPEEGVIAAVTDDLATIVNVVRLGRSRAGQETDHRDVVLSGGRAGRRSGEGIGPITRAIDVE